eukprot:scaffold24508_cov132-Cylindrotheca_fusiformis.AAC.2
MVSPCHHDAMLLLKDHSNFPGKLTCLIPCCPIGSIAHTFKRSLKSSRELDEKIKALGWAPRLAILEDERIFGNGEVSRQLGTSYPTQACHHVTSYLRYMGCIRPKCDRQNSPYYLMSYIPTK